MKFLTAQQISELLSVTKRTVQKRAIRELWEFREKRGRGGLQRIYDVDLLPPDVQQAITAQTSELDIEVSTFHLLQQEEQLAGYGSAITQEIFTKYRLIQAAKAWVNHYEYGKIDGYDRFCEQYNDRQLAFPEHVYHIVTTVSRISLLRWESRYESGGLLGLTKLGTRYQNEVERLIRQSQFNMVMQLFQTNPQVSSSLIRRFLALRFATDELPSVLKITAWIAHLKEQFIARQSASDNMFMNTWLLLLLPCHFVVPERARDIHVYVFINVATGDHLVMPADSRSAVGLLTRELIIRFGKPDEIHFMPDCEPDSTLQVVLSVLGIRQVIVGVDRALPDVARHFIVQLVDLLRTVTFQNERQACEQTIQRLLLWLECTSEIAPWRSALSGQVAMALLECLTRVSGEQGEHAASGTMISGVGTRKELTVVEQITDVFFPVICQWDKKGNMLPEGIVQIDHDGIYWKGYWFWHDSFHTMEKGWVRCFCDPLDDRYLIVRSMTGRVFIGFAIRHQPSEHR